MKKVRIKIPQGIEYISNWKEYSLPRGEHCIVDKGVTGCGYTEFALTNNDNIVLCSPRKLLLENKAESHIEDDNILYLRADCQIDLDLQILNHIEACRSNNKPIKFMITYDSAYKISKCLTKYKITEKFIYVIDEFQSIFIDSYFKSSVEFSFVEDLQSCESIIYLSATPMLDKYLDKLERFKDLTCYKLDWSDTGFVKTIIIKRKRTNHLSTECCKIVNDYLNGKFPTKVLEGGKVIQSREAVFYFNSISEILRVIRKCGLTSKNTSIICSKTEDNRIRLKKSGFEFGKVPLKTELNPMFTFCTSAVYMGVDFHSDCASSFVFANPNISNLSLDISLDLPQIIGRQRNKFNPFKEEIILFYKTKINDKGMERQDFDLLQEERRRGTEKILSLYGKIIDDSERMIFKRKLLESIEYSKYCLDFISFNKEGLPVYNYLIDIANERAWDVSQKDYQDKISLAKCIDSVFNSSSEEYLDFDEKLVQDFLNNTFFLDFDLKRKLRVYCNFRDKYKDSPRIIESVINKVRATKGADQFDSIYNYFGTEGCRLVEFDQELLKSNMSKRNMKKELDDNIYEHFKEGDSIITSETKLILENIYKSLGFKYKAKVSDLSEYFEMFPGKFKDSDGKFKNGFKLGKRLQ